jgi:hypothetical protein
MTAYLFSMQTRAQSSRGDRADAPAPQPDHDTENPKLAHGDEAPSNLEKDPDDWVTGDEPMTGAQASYLKTLSEEAHEPFTPHLTKRQASKLIDHLQSQTGRGKHP